MRNFLFCALLAAPLPVAAQSLSVTPLSVQSANDPVLRVGTQVPLRLIEDLTTKGKQLRVGQRFHMEVAEAVTVNGMLVIPVGSPAVGEITDVRNKGMWGKSGHLSGRALYVVVGGRQIRLTGNLDDKGVAGGWGAAATSAIVFAPAGFFMTGTSAHLPSGTAIRAFVDEDVALTTPGMQRAAPMAAPAMAQPAVETPQAATATPVAATPVVPAMPVAAMTATQPQGARMHAATHDEPLPAAVY